MSAVLKNAVILLCFLSCLNAYAQTHKPFEPKVVYKSKDLIVTRISEKAFEHTSFKQTQDFGNVSCNGLIVSEGSECVVFDTPTNDKNSEELIACIQATLHCSIRAVIPTHFHDDCLGGLKAFHSHQIPSYAYYKTIELAKENKYAVPENSFRDSLVLPVGNAYVTAKFFGEGHSRDNVVGYFPAENILFGGCLIKELGAGKGYLGDANVAAWPGTVENVRKEYRSVAIVIPGHGEYGGEKLLDYTIQLFQKK